MMVALAPSATVDGDATSVLFNHQPTHEEIMSIEPKTLPRPCWFRFPSRHGDWARGTLHAWSISYGEFGSGKGVFPIGIVEDEAGQVDIAYVRDISLASESPAEPRAQPPT